MKIGISFYSVQEEYEKNPLRALDEIVAAGYDVMEISRYDRIDRNALRRAMDERGIKAVSGHFLLPDFEGDMYEDTLDYAAVMGIDTLVIPIFQGIGFSNYENTVATAKKFDDIAARLGERGYQLLYHNHIHEFSTVHEGKCIADILFEHTSNLGFELDIGWSYASGCDNVSYIRKLGSRLKMIHIKDVDDSKTPTEVGTGMVNIKESIDAAILQGVEIGIVEQDHRRVYPAFTSIRVSRNNLRNLGY